MEYEYSKSYDTLDTLHGSVETSLSNLVDRNLHILHPRTSSSSPATSQNVQCPPSLADQIHQAHGSRCANIVYGDIATRSPLCSEKTFNAASAKTFVHRLANPCHPDFTGSSKSGRTVSDFFNKRHALSHIFGQIPGTPPTSSGSSSDESQSDYDSTALDVPPTPSRCRTKGETIGELTYNKGQNVLTSPKCQASSNLAVTGEKNDLMISSLRSPPPSGCDLVLLVGDQRYLLSSSSMGLASKYVSQRQNLSAEGYFIVDLSTHSPEEWRIVLEFLKPSADSEEINWSNLPVVLPWFVEFQALAMMKEVDSFLLHNLLGGRRDGSGERPISLPNLLKVTKVAIVCGLETTKLQARRLLRQGLLEPRKSTVHAGCVESGVVDDEEIELEWTLDDLQVLTRMMECFDDLRRYLWEYAVIVYLPHDLDVSDSLVLVSNPLFPYLLREGMMQMMIVQGLDGISSYTRKPQNQNLGSSGSMGSDTTIPTNHASAFGKHQTQEEVQNHLHRIIQHLEKFQVERYLRTKKELRPTSGRSLSYEGGSPRENRRKKKLGAGHSSRPSKAKPETFEC
jgi:hypothetical protein